MLVLRPYHLPAKPTEKQLTGTLNSGRPLDDAEKARGTQSRTLQCWAHEKPECVDVANQGKFAIVRVFEQYRDTLDETKFDSCTHSTRERRTEHRLTRRVTLWIPLAAVHGQPRNPNDFALCLGDLEEKRVADLVVKLLPGADPRDVKAGEFDFADVRKHHDNGWLHGCVNRPSEIQTGVFYGDFHFHSASSELERYGFLDSPQGMKSNQEGVVLTMGRPLKVRVLKHGRFQIVGVRKQHFLEPVPERERVMDVCFRVARDLMKSWHAAPTPAPVGRATAPMRPASRAKGAGMRLGP